MLVSSVVASSFSSAGAVDESMSSSLFGKSSEKQAIKRKHQNSAADTKIPTVITLNEPPAKVYENEIILFIGTLKTKDDQAINGGKVWIKYTDARGAQHFLGSSTTDINGKFIIKWVSQIVGVTSMEVYAEFTGNDDYLKSKSKSFSITIEKQKPSLIVVKTDRKMYELDDYVTISGKVTELKMTNIVGIEVLNPEGRYFKTAQAPIVSGSFSWKFLLAGENAVPGKYSVIVKYWHDTVVAEFLLDGDGMEESVKTILLLNPPHMTIQKGDLLSFTGSLMSDDRMVGIPNAKIRINYIDEKDQMNKIASGTTDNEGKFTIKWQSDLDFLGKIRIYALFEGERMFEGAASQEYLVTLATKAKNFQVTIDRQSYGFGETMKITGSVPSLVDIPAVIEVIDSEQNVLLTDSIQISSDGSFSYQFVINGDMAPFRTYDVKIIHNGDSKMFQIGVMQPKSGFITIENMCFVDPLNLPVNELSVGKEIFMKVVMKNNVDLKQDLFAIMQVQDSEGFTVFISSTEHVIQSRETISLENSWTPKSSGEFKVSMFLLQNNQNPLVLLKEPFTVDVTVY